MPLEHRTGKTFAKGSHYPSERPSLRTASTSPSTPNRRPTSSCCCSTSPTAIPPMSFSWSNRDRFVWHALVKGLGPGQLYGYKVERRVPSGVGAALQRRQAAARPVRKGGHGKVPQHRQPAARLRSPARRGRARSRYARQHPHRSQVHRRRRCLRLAGGDVTRPRSRAAGDLRSARQGFHRPPVVGRQAAPAPISGSSRRSRISTRLGINAVELLPVHECYVDDFLEQKGLTNYWGYNSIGFFAPESSYCTGRDARLPGRRVQDAGSRAAQGGHQSDPRRRLQPHGRRERDGTEPVASAASTTRPTTA